MVSDLSSGSAWLASLPDTYSPERDQAVLAAVQADLAYCHWLPLTVSIPGHTATFQICDDAVRVDLDDGSRFRPQVTAILAQQCADILEASFLTSKLCDLAYVQTEPKMTACLEVAGPQMSTTAASKAWNVALEAKRAGRGGWVRDCGKAWICSARMVPGKAINHGFYDPVALYVNRMGQKMWQVEGAAHNNQHTDYSQTLQLMSKICVVDGQEMAVDKVMIDPELAHLLSYDGVLHYTRQV